METDRRGQRKEPPNLFVLRMTDSSSPADEPQDDARTERAGVRPGGFTLDLSSGGGTQKPVAWKRKQKQTNPLFTKVMDLSSPPQTTPVAPSPVKTTKPEAEQPRQEQSRPEKRRGKPASGGSTLADLLDADTLARLRGDSDA